MNVRQAWMEISSAVEAQGDERITEARLEKDVLNVLRRLESAAQRAERARQKPKLEAAKQARLIAENERDAIRSERDAIIRARDNKALRIAADELLERLQR